MPFQPLIPYQYPLITLILFQHFSDALHAIPGAKRNIPGSIR